MSCFSFECTNQVKWLVNARYREAQSQSCGVHLDKAVVDLSSFNNPEYKRRSPDNGVTVFPAA